jgi:arylsulfatase A-like enzyme
MTDRIRIDRRRFLGLVGTGVLASAVLPDSLSRAAAGFSKNKNGKKRNVVVILCDQLRKDFLSIYGCNAAATPNLQRLARMGVVFDNAITQSTVCAPARASMMTGRYVSDHKVWANDLPFRDGVEYIAERMNQLNYTTAAFGKMHHKPANDPKGFQNMVFMEEDRLGPNEPYLQWLKKHHPQVKSVFNYDQDKLVFDFTEEQYYEHWIASQAIKFIEHHAESSNKPFFAWISFQGPHGPFDPPKEVKGSVNAALLPERIRDFKNIREIPNQVHQYRSAIFSLAGDDDRLREIRIAYAEMIVEIDRQIGRILQKLESLAIMDNTTVIFSADHGDSLGDHMQKGKGPYAYSPQLNIPLIVSNHPEIKAATHSDSLVGNIDIPGTVLDIAGAKRTIGYSQSLINLARQNPVNPREVNFSEFCDSVKTVENKRYRYSYYPFLNFSELYDKKNDPHELHNLAGRGEYAQLEAEFTRHIIEFGLIAKGFTVEAHDFVRDAQQGLRKKNPVFEHEFPLAYPIQLRHREMLKKAGLEEDYNDFCRGKKILNSRNDRDGSYKTY